jgi:hypothetical protein
MKVRVTLELSDDFRSYVAATVSTSAKTRQGLATRTACRAWIIANLAQLGDLPHLHFDRVDLKDFTEAVDYLRKAGRTDDEIRRWLMTQRAIAFFPLTKRPA